jgi:hypothetical protein
MAMAAAGVLQIPVAVYLLCKSNRMTPSGLILDITACAPTWYIRRRTAALLNCLCMHAACVRVRDMIVTYTYLTT